MSRGFLYRVKEGYKRRILYTPAVDVKTLEEIFNLTLS